MSVGEPERIRVKFPIRKNSEDHDVGRFSMESTPIQENSELSQSPIESGAEQAIERFEQQEETTVSDDRSDLLAALGVLISNSDFSMAEQVALRLLNYPDLDDSQLRDVLGVFQKTQNLEGEESALLGLQKRLNSEGSEAFEVHKALGNVRLKMQDFDGAEESYFKAFRIEPHSSVLLVNIGTLEFRKNQYSSARERFVQAIDSDPSNDKAWVGLGLVHSCFADFDLALANLETALDLESGNRTGIQLYTDIAFKHGDLHKLSERLSEYLKTNSTDIEFLICASKVALILSQSSIGLEYANAVLDLEPENSEALQLIEACSDISEMEPKE